jgi:hypothetical protein
MLGETCSVTSERWVRFLQSHGGVGELRTDFAGHLSIGKQGSDGIRQSLREGRGALSAPH